MRHLAPRSPSFSSYAPTPTPTPKPTSHMTLPRTHFLTRRGMECTYPIAHCIVPAHVPIPIHPFFFNDSSPSTIKRRATATITAYQRTELYSQRPLQKVTIPSLNENGDPYGKKELGRKVVKWVCQGMRKMAVDFVASEPEFDQLATLIQPFVAHAQGYLSAVPMPLGYESVCLKIRTHYPTLFDHFQRELKDVLQKQRGDTWQASVSWRLLKHLASSPQHRAIARRAAQPPSDLKIREMQGRIDEFTRVMGEMLRVERDAELETTQDELNAVSEANGVEFIVSRSRGQHELCDTICNVCAVSSSVGLGGMNLVLFRSEEGSKLPPSSLSPGDMVCVRICDENGAGSTSCIQGFVDRIGEDECSITVAVESPSFTILFGKNIRIDRIYGLADSLTYERNCEALMMLQKHGLRKNNPAIEIVKTLFGEEEGAEMGELGQVEVKEDLQGDESQKKAALLGANSKRPVLILQGPPGTGKSGLLKEIISIAVRQGEKVLVTAPTNAAVDNMVEKLLLTGLNVVRVGNPARISSSVASRSLGEIVRLKLMSFKAEYERKKEDLRKDLRMCLKDDSLAAGIRLLLKQLGKNMRKKEMETVREVMENAEVVLATNTGAADPYIKRLAPFDLVVIDEASQAIEPSCWISLLQGKRCIISGDKCQLAPVILSRQAMEGGLGVSLLERAASLYGGALETKLTTQYRMNDSIAKWASEEMYGGELVSSPSVASRLLADMSLVKRNWMTLCPLLLLDTRMQYGNLSFGCEENLDPAGSGSFYNDGEAEIVLQHVVALIYSGVKPASIAVQSPYVAQVQLLRERMDEVPCADGVEVSTIDSFQGREADAVIISMVRSNTLGAVGFLGDSRRMNVAITRARRHVAVVCDSSTICHNTFLARLLRHIRHHGRVKHAEPGGSSDLDMIPSLR